MEGRKRGRPKQEHETQTEVSRKRTQIVKYEDGTVVTWKWDLDVTPYGPVETIVDYPKGYKHWDEINATLPKYQRMYPNDETGKMVNYQRAKQLGII